MKKNVIFIYIVLLFFLSFYFSGCENSNEPIQLISKSEYIVLEWDHPSHGLTKGPQAVHVYQVYYRIYGSSFWTFIAEVPAEDGTKCTLNHEDLGDGMYEFAVRAVNPDGITSALHASGDQMADPYGGWYLLWIKSD